IQGSGTPGNVITILFEPGAKLSKPAWGTDSTSAISGNGTSYITIDGGTNGKIENTNNGTALGLQQDSVFVNGHSITTWTVKNLTLSTLYVRSANSSDTNLFGTAINLVGSYVTVQNCTVSDTATGVALGFR